MAHKYSWFVDPCLEAFDCLRTRCGFGAPRLHRVGRDCYVLYQKGNRWIAIGYRIGYKPVVELHFPSWHIKCRRVPRLDLGLTDGEAFADTNEQEQVRTLRALAADLALKERRFIHGESVSGASSEGTSEAKGRRRSGSEELGTRSGGYGNLAQFTV